MTVKVLACCLCQKNISKNDSLFLNGFSLADPKYTFQWNFQLNNIPKEKFKNFRIERKGSTVVHVKFDSALFGDAILLNHVIIKGKNKKNKDDFTTYEFIGLTDYETINKLALHFDYNWNGWIFYPKEKPLYKFRLAKDKQNIWGIVIDKF